MTSFSARGRDPQPVSQGCEVAAAVIGAAVLVAGLAALLGVGAASAVAGGGWVWPHGTSTIGHVLGGLLTGHPDRGWDPRQAPLVASAGPVYLGVAVCEVIVAAVVAATTVAAVRYRRPGDARRGMATRGEARQVLGRSRLRAARSIIRPDLYPDQHGPPPDGSFTAPGNAVRVTPFTAVPVIHMFPAVPPVAGEPDHRSRHHRHHP